MKKYIDTKTENMKIKVETYYSLGGMNYFTYKVEPRGYYLSVTPVERVVRDGYVSEGYSAFSGYKKLLLEVQRKSKKKEAEAETMAESQAHDIVERVCNENNLELA